MVPLPPLHVIVAVIETRKDMINTKTSYIYKTKKMEEEEAEEEKEEKKTKKMEGGEEEEGERRRSSLQPPSGVLPPHWPPMP